MAKEDLELNEVKWPCIKTKDRRVKILETPEIRVFEEKTPKWSS